MVVLSASVLAVTTRVGCSWFYFFFFFFFKQKTAYEIVSRDWSSDVCSSDLKRVKSQQENGINTQPEKSNKKASSSQGNGHSFQPQVYSDDDL